MLRVPLPIKVFMSYVLVLAIGVGPIYFYLNQVLEKGVVEADLQDLADRTLTLADTLGTLPPTERVAYLEARRELWVDRLSLIEGDGMVVFDTEKTRPTTNHNDRPEIRRARGVASPQALDFKTLQLHGAGVARRVSVTANDERMYVALPIAGTVGTNAPVIRVSRSVGELAALKVRVTGFLRNTLAAAVSVAILLSLLSAYVLLRPLRRVRAAAAALAGGDWTVQFEHPSDDEVGDIARSLERLGVELRKKMALHGTAEGLVEQLVEVTPAAAAIFSHDGKVIAVNGPGRIALHIEGPTAGRRIRALLKDDDVAAAMKATEDEGVPQAIEIALDEGRTVIGELSALKRPAKRPWFAFIADTPADTHAEPLHPTQVRTRTLEDIVTQAHKNTTRSLRESNVDFEAPTLPDVTLADAESRLQFALEGAFRASASVLAGKGKSLSMQVSVEGTRVGVALSTSFANAEVQKLRPLVEPLGGAIELAANEVTLWLPRA